MLQEFSAYIANAGKSKKDGSGGHPESLAQMLATRVGRVGEW
jgi:hypothetical protein